MPPGPDDRANRDGMTTRDVFAEGAMRAYARIWIKTIAGKGLSPEAEAAGLARIAYLVADAMLKERTR